MTTLNCVALGVLLVAEAACSSSSGGSAPPGSGGGPKEERASQLPVLFGCNQPDLKSCHESYFNFEPASTVACGTGRAVRNQQCERGSGFLGACRSGIHGGGGYLVQSVLYYYEGHGGSTDRAQVEQSCKVSGGEYLPN